MLYSRSPSASFKQAVINLLLFQRTPTSRPTVSSSASNELDNETSNESAGGVQEQRPLSPLAEGRGRNEEEELQLRLDDRVHRTAAMMARVPIPQRLEIGNQMNIQMIREIEEIPAAYRALPPAERSEIALRKHNLDQSHADLTLVTASEQDLPPGYNLAEPRTVAPTTPARIRNGEGPPSGMAWQYVSNLPAGTSAMYSSPTRGPPISFQYLSGNPRTPPRTPPRNLSRLPASDSTTASIYRAATPTTPTPIFRRRT